METPPGIGQLRQQFGQMGLSKSIGQPGQSIPWK